MIVSRVYPVLSWRETPVENSSKWKRYQTYLLVMFAFFIATEFLISYSNADEEKKMRYGLSVFGGTGDAIHNKPDLTAYGVFPRVDFSLHKYWDLEFEGNFSYWNISGEKDLYFLGANANFVFKPLQWTWGSLFLLGGGGLGYDSAGKHVHEIGDSHFGGILQAGAGIYYNLGKGLALRGEYRFYHISEPFRNDDGLNSHIFLFGISF